MPRTRSRSASQQSVSTDYTDFRSKINEWFQDIYADVDAKTGYLVKQPTGFYGSKVRSLVRYIYMQSSEVKAIQANQQIHASSMCIYLFHIVKYLSEYILPALFSFVTAYLYYVTESPTPYIPAFNYTEPVTPILENTTTWFPSVSEAGALLGDLAHTTLSVPIQFFASTLDRTLHLKEGLEVVQSNSQKLFWTPLIAIGVYILSFVLLKCLLNMQHLLSSQWALWTYQALFLKETEEAIERAVTGIIRPYLVTQYEQLLFQSSDSQQVDSASRNSIKSLYLTYNNDMELLHETLHERADQYIRSIPFAEILVLGRLSKQYMAALYALIRDSSEHLSSTLFELNQQLLQPTKRQLTYSL
jgi:hypothetical protein